MQCLLAVATCNPFRKSIDTIIPFSHFFLEQTANSSCPIYFSTNHWSHSRLKLSCGFSLIVIPRFCYACSKQITLSMQQTLSNISLPLHSCYQSLAEGKHNIHPLFCFSLHSQLLRETSWVLVALCLTWLVVSVTRNHRKVFVSGFFFKKKLSPQTLI